MPSAQGTITVRRRPLDGADGKDGQSAFKSIVFIRSASTPTTPTGGSYASPVPSGWSDGIPPEYNGYPVWMSSRIFTSDGLSPQTNAWTDPQEVSNTHDIEFMFSSVASNPGSPTTKPGNWYDVASTNDIWMAMRTITNGLWGIWQINRIKGEKGDKGDKGNKGDDGAQGQQGAILRGIEWKVGIQIECNSNHSAVFPLYIDYVIRRSGENSGFTVYKAQVEHVAAENKNPGVSTGWQNYWEVMNNFSSIATGLLLAKNAKIEFLQGNQILIQKSNGTICAGLAGSSIPLWIGADTATNAPFRVSEDGSFVSAKATITGNITATSGKIGQFDIHDYSIGAKDENSNGLYLSNNFINFRDENVKVALGIDVTSPYFVNKSLIDIVDTRDKMLSEGLTIYFTGNKYKIGVRSTAAIISKAFVADLGYTYITIEDNQALNTDFNTIISGLNNPFRLLLHGGTNSSIVLPSCSSFRDICIIDDSETIYYEMTLVNTGTTNISVYGRNSHFTSKASDGTIIYPYDTYNYPQIYNSSNKRAMESFILYPGQGRRLLISSNYNKGGASAFFI